MLEKLFKIYIVIISILGVGLLYLYPYKQLTGEKEVEAFRICMNTISEEVLRDVGALKANLTLCKEISENF